MELTEKEKELVAKINDTFPDFNKADITKNMAIHYAQTDRFRLRLLLEDYWDDKEVAMVAVANDGLYFHSVSERLQNDIDVIRAAYTNSPKLFEREDFLTHKNRVIGDREFIIEAIEKSSNPFLPPEYSNDEEICKIALRRSPFLFEYCSEQFRDDESFVRKAVSEWGEMIKYASERLRSDKEFLLDILMNREAYGNTKTGYPYSILEYLPKEFRNDEEIVAACVMLNDYEYKYASRRLRMNPDFALSLMMSLDVDLYYLLTPSLQKNEDISSYLHRKYTGEK